MQILCYSGAFRSPTDLDSAFALVDDSNDWRNPINAAMSIAAFEKFTPELITDAVVFFTGSLPEMERHERLGIVRIRAAGYFLTHAR